MLSPNMPASSSIAGAYQGSRKLTKEFITETAFQRAYKAWFSEYDRERRRQKKRPGARLADFPSPPTCPEDIAAAVDTIGKSRTLAVLGVHRSTLARWLAGTQAIPRPSWLLLVLLAEGRLPGMSDDWRDFAFIGDRLTMPGTRLSLSAREIAGWRYQQQHAAALARRVADLEKQNAQLLRLGVFESANDPIICAS